MSDYTLVGVDGNAFSVIGHVKKIMKKEHYSQEEIDEYIRDATSRDYDYLISASIDKLHEINYKKRGNQS